MANPQPIPFVQFSKELFGAVLLSPMTSTQRGIVLAIIRRTYGDGGRKQAEISVGLLAKMLAKNKGTVSRALRDLEDNGVVTVVRPAHLRRPQVLALNKDYETWGSYCVSAADACATVADEQPWPERNGCAHATQRLLPCNATVAPMQRNGCSQATTEEGRQEQTVDKNTTPKRQVVSAPSDVDWQARSDALLEESHFPSDLLQLGEILAGENKTGKAALSRIVRELYEPIVGLQDSLSDEALRYGLRAAITAGAPNWRYVRKAAEGYRPNGHAGAGYGGGLSVEDILSGSFEPASVLTPDYDLEAEAIDDDS